MIRIKVQKPLLLRVGAKVAGLSPKISSLFAASLRELSPGNYEVAEEIQVGAGQELLVDGITGFHHDHIEVLSP